MNGVVIDDPNCTGAEGKVTVVQEVNDRFYCITADTTIDAWIIGQQLLGKTPTDEEVARMRAALEDE